MMDEVAKRFEQYKREIERETLEADELAAKAAALQLKAREKQLRVDKGLPSPHSCPDCLVKRGIDSRLEAVTADDPSRFDRWRCRKCGLFFDVSSR